jgi:hypothetical protein
MYLPESVVMLIGWGMEWNASRKSRAELKGATLTRLPVEPGRHQSQRA